MARRRGWSVFTVPHSDTKAGLQHFHTVTYGQLPTWGKSDLHMISRTFRQERQLSGKLAVQRLSSGGRVCRTGPAVHFRPLVLPITAGSCLSSDTVNSRYAAFE